MPFDNKDYGDFFDSYSPERREQQKSQKKHKRRLKPWVKIAFAVLSLALVAVLIIVSVSSCSDKSKKGKEVDDGTSSITSDSGINNGEYIPNGTDSPSAVVDGNTVSLYSEIDSTYGVLVDISNNKCLAMKNPDEIMYPASLTKVMALLVAAENIDDLYGGTITMTSEIIDPLYQEGAAMAGFMPGEVCKVEDLFYGSMLESGAEATAALGIYIAGSEEAFVEMMNDKAKELGLKNTHFVNTTGLHDPSHYTTCNEFAVIMSAALKNDFCKKLLTTKHYRVPANEYHGELNFYSTALTRVHSKYPDNKSILGGKTGYTSNSGNCLVTYGMTENGRDIVCVTAKASDKDCALKDHIYLFDNYAK